MPRVGFSAVHLPEKSSSSSDSSPFSSGRLSKLGAIITTNGDRLQRAQTPRRGALGVGKYFDVDRLHKKFVEFID